MAIKTISIKGTDSKDVAGQAKEALKDFEVKVLLFFASSFYDDTNPAAELAAAFPDSRIIGSTSHSEYCNSDYTDHSVSIMAMDQDSVEDACIQVVENIDREVELQDAVKNMETHFGGSEEIFNNFDKYVGIVLFESGAKAEEIFMDRLGTATDILRQRTMSPKCMRTARAMSMRLFLRY